MSQSQSGRGFLSGLVKGLKSANSFLRKNKVISTIGSIVPHAGAQKVAGIAGALGYGRRRRVRRRRPAQRGKGILSGLLGSFGLGRKRRVRRRRPRVMVL